MFSANFKICNMFCDYCQFDERILMRIWKNCSTISTYVSPTTLTRVGLDFLVLFSLKTIVKKKVQKKPNFITSVLKLTNIYFESLKLSKNDENIFKKIILLKCIHSCLLQQSFCFLHNFDQLTFRYFYQQRLVWKSAVKSNEKLVNQKLCQQ